MTLNDKRYLLVSIARKYASYRYEIDELVNEAWLNKNVRAQTERKRFYIAARWAIISYMRKQEKRGHKKYHIHTQPLITGENRYITEPEVVPFNNLEYIGLYSWLRKGLTPKQKLIVELRLNGLEWKEIGRTLGHSKQYVFQLWKKACGIMKERYQLRIA